MGLEFTASEPGNRAQNGFWSQDNPASLGSNRGDLRQADMEVGYHERYGPTGRQGEEKHGNSRTPKPLPRIDVHWRGYRTDLGFDG
jgi:hypothetical protein